MKKCTHLVLALSWSLTGGLSDWLTPRSVQERDPPKESGKERILNQRTDQCVNTANSIPVRNSIVPPKGFYYSKTLNHRWYQLHKQIIKQSVAMCIQGYVWLAQISKFAFLVLAFNFPNFFFTPLKYAVWYQAKHAVHRICYLLIT